MKRKGGKYTYIPKDEIAEVRTFNDVSFESDDLLDGAYVRGRKKFKHGGMTHKRPMSLEEQAAESVGYDTWYAMDAVDQKELVDELLVSGMINPMFALGGEIKIEGDIDANEDVFVYVDGKEVVSWSADEIAEDDYAEETVREVIRLSRQDPNELLRRIKIMKGGYMADGGMAKGGIYSSDERWVVKFQNQDTGEFEEVVVRADNKKSAIDIAEDESGLSSDWEYYSAKKEKVEEREAKEYVNPKYMADGGMMAKAWLVDEKDGLPKVIKYKSVEAAKKNQFDDMADNPYKRPLFTSFKSLADYLDKEYDLTNIESYRYMAVKMADGGNIKSLNQLKEIQKKFDINEGENRHSENVVLLADAFGSEQDKMEARRILALHKRERHLSEENGKNRRDLSLKLFKAWDEEKEKYGLMADGGITSNDSFKQSAIDEAIKIAQFAYENDITASGNSLEKFSNKIFEASGMVYAKPYLALAYQSMRNQGFADGGEISYVVKYSMKDTPEVVKEKIFTDKDAAELFHETISDDEDLVVMDLEVVKPKPAPAPAPAKKSSLFASAKPVPATAAARKKQREQVQVDGIADEIARYDQLKATINNAKAEQEVIGGRLKELGREKFLDLYEQRGVRPANFDLADGDQNILLEVTDKYLKVEPEKAELLRQYDGLLEEKTTYEFDSEILEKEVSDGMTIGDVVSMLIQDSKLIPDSDKANLIKAKMSMRVPKGTLDRLMQYDNPREVFSLISPILALK